MVDDTFIFLVTELAASVRKGDAVAVIEFYSNKSEHVKQVCFCYTRAVVRSLASFGRNGPLSMLDLY